MAYRRHALHVGNIQRLELRPIEVGGDRLSDVPPVRKDVRSPVGAAPHEAAFLGQLSQAAEVAFAGGDSARISSKCMRGRGKADPFKYAAEERAIPGWQWRCPSYSAFILGSPCQRKNLPANARREPWPAGHERHEVRADGIARRDVFKLWFEPEYKRRIGLTTTACFSRSFFYRAAWSIEAIRLAPLGARSCQACLPDRVACGQDAGQL